MLLSSQDLYVRLIKLTICALPVISGMSSADAWAQQTPPPNLVVVMTDDLSTTVMDTLLAEGRAPNIQRYLIDEGHRFENAFVTNSLCCPSKATFLRGQYTHNHGVFSNFTGAGGFGIKWPGWLTEGGQIGKEESTVATWLHDFGYHTGHIGRYLNGYGIQGPEGFGDPKLYIPPGWDVWQGLIAPFAFEMYDYVLNDNGVLVTYGATDVEYQTDVLAQRAVAYIDQRAAAAQPFFLNVWTAAPHNEGGSITIRPAPRHQHLIDGDTDNGEISSIISALKPSFNEADISDKPSCISFATPAAPHLKCVGDLPTIGNAGLMGLNSQYKAMIAAMMAVDDLLGSVMAALEANGLAGNTVVLLTSDNGWTFGDHRVFGKDVPYEESIRIPFLMRAPGYVGGQEVAHIVLNNDIAPTLADLAAVPLPYEPDGTSLVPLLENPGRTDWHRRAFLVEHFFIPPGAESLGLATFAAIRRLAPPSNYLYVSTYADPADPRLATHREHYDLQWDPYQFNSITLSISLDNAMLSWLSALRLCKGAGCINLESR